MTKVVFPDKAAREVPWLVQFVGGFLRGLMTVGASGVLTVFALLWLRANGYLSA